MIAYPTKALVTMWRKGDDGVWRKIKTTHKIAPGADVIVQLGELNDERTHVKSVEFLYV